MLFSRQGRRRRKSSPEPDSSTAVGLSGRSGDLVHRKPALSHESTLPTHYTSNNSKNFLLGGNYYPGKDKRLRRRRGRRWNRCRGLHVAVLALISFSFVAWYSVVPLINGTIATGKADDYLSLLHDKSYLSSKSLKEEMESASLIVTLRQRLRQQSKLREQVLEKLTPQWYHRNDHDVGTDKKRNRKARDSGGEDTVPGKKKSRKHPEGRDIPKNDKNEKGKNPNKKSEHGSKRGVNHSGLRTIHSMDSNGDHSACPTSLPVDDIQTTLVLQTSVDRMWILNETCARWKDPIVAVVAIRRDDSRAGVSAWKEGCPQLSIIKFDLTGEYEAAESYPVNVLRNLGLDSVKTSHVLVMDIDFVPSAGLDETIRQVLQQRSELREHVNDLHSDTHEAMVVPAFDRLINPPCQTEAECMQHLRLNSSFIPHTFEDLKLCYQQKDCAVFQSNVNAEGHSSTRTASWLHGEWYDESVRVQLEDKRELKGIRVIDCFDSLRYEPYVVIRWCPSGQSSGKPLAPYYDERFHGYGKNKIQHVQHLRLMGYGFAVLPEGFIVHNPHLESQVKERWNDMRSSHLHKEMDELYMTFLHELLHAYEDEIREGTVIEACLGKKAD